MTYQIGYCAICKSDTQKVVIPLHDDQGGPLVCHFCAGRWHAQHGRRRRAGRVVIRAIHAYGDAGGKWSDVDKLKQSALGRYVGGIGGDVFGLDPLGYMADAIRTDGENIDLTSELLSDAVRLTHPDCHPPERQELARRVTQELLALKPFAFPALKPKAVDPTPAPHSGSIKVPARNFKEPLRPSYPCKECKSTIPYFYCSPCRAEWNKRNEARRNCENAKQRKWYAARRARRPAAVCTACHTKFKGKRKDAKFCSNTCRQRAHRGASQQKVRPRSLRSLKPARLQTAIWFKSALRRRSSSIAFGQSVRRSRLLL
jgi:hypothetical protein